MTCIAKFLVLSWVLGLALTIPICVKNCADKGLSTQDIEIKNKIIVSEVNNNHLNKSEDCSQDDASDCSSSSEEDTPQEEVDTTGTAREFGVKYLQPTILTSVPYQGYQNVEDLRVGVGNYDGGLYPHVHPKLLGKYNSGYNVKSLPPVLSTYIHGLIPQEEMQRAVYDSDTLNPENQGYLSAVSRPSRMLRVSEEEWLAELQHDAIMSNILPTMQIPFARYAGPATYGPATFGPASGVSAVFPNAAVGGCAQPILFTCSPRIIRGTLRPVDSYQPAPAYRQDTEPIKNINDKHNAPVKLDLVRKTAPSITNGKKATD